MPDAQNTENDEMTDALNHALADSDTYELMGILGRMARAHHTGQNQELFASDSHWCCEQRLSSTSRRVCVPGCGGLVRIHRNQENLRRIVDNGCQDKTGADVQVRARLAPSAGRPGSNGPQAVNRRCSAGSPPLRLGSQSAAQRPPPPGSHSPCSHRVFRCCTGGTVCLVKAREGNSRLADELDRQIDEIVYRIYGVIESEKLAIEEWLSKSG